MSKKSYSQEQIVYALKQLEGGAKGCDVCRQMGVSEATLYSWKKKYAGMGVGELRELRQLREENKRLKQMVADLSLDKHILQERAMKKGVRPARRRALVDEVVSTYGLSIRWVCGLLELNISTYYYRSHAGQERWRDGSANWRWRESDTATVA